MLDSIFLFYSPTVYYSTLDFKSLSYRYFRLAEIFDRHSHAGTWKCFALLWVTDVPLAEFSLLRLLMQFKLICSFGRKDLILTELSWARFSFFFFSRKWRYSAVGGKQKLETTVTFLWKIAKKKKTDLPPEGWNFLSPEKNSTIFSRHFIELCKLRLGDETFGFLKFVVV